MNGKHCFKATDFNLVLLKVKALFFTFKSNQKLVNLTKDQKTRDLRTNIPNFSQHQNLIAA